MRPSNHLSLAGAMLASAALLALAGCATGPAPTVSQPAPERPMLRVGVTADMAPMIFRQGQEFTGLEADLARQLAAALGRDLRFVEVRWDAQIDTLLAGKTDIIMSGLTATAARAIRIDFTQTYLRAGQVALVRRPDAAKVQVLLLAQKFRVGVQKGTTGDYFVQQNLTLSERVPFNTARDGAKALVDGRIDVFIHDAPVNWWLAAENEARGLTVLPALLTEEYLAWGVRKDDTALRDAVNQFLTEARKDGRLNAIIRRWLPQAQ